MIADILELLATPRSARIMRGTLSKRLINDTFDQIRSDLGAHTVHRQVRARDRNTSVVWSLWIGRFEKQVAWLTADRFTETRYAFALLLERADFVGVAGSNVGDIGDLVSDNSVSYQKLLALHSETTSEIESLSTRSLRAARFGVLRSTQTGRHLETSLSRVGANQAAPSQLSLRQADQTWRISPGSGRITVSGGRTKIPDLCSWFATTCDAIERATEPTDFIKAFAHPVRLNDLPTNVFPTALQLDATIVDDLIESGATLHRSEAPMSDSDIEAIRQLIRDLWLIDQSTSDATGESKAWRLNAADHEVGQLVMRSTKISFVSPVLADVVVHQNDGTSLTLNQLFNSNAQPLRVTFSDPSYGYAAGQLFCDHRLVGSRQALLDVLSDRLPPEASTEKSVVGGRFADGSLFGFVVDQASAGNDHLVCDDIGTEWADFIGVSTPKHEVTFFHCKGGRTEVGASDLHEVVSQATKNLGYLTATVAELENRKPKWTGIWNNTRVRRLQRGSTVDDFVAAFTASVAAPQAARRVVLVTSSLSKSAVAAAFAGIASGTMQPEATHVLWLLLGFVDQCRNIGAVPDIMCRP